MYNDIDLKKMFEIAGVDPEQGKAKELIVENIEDRHSEVYGAFEDKIKQVSDTTKRKQLQKDFANAMKTFDKGHETDNDNLMTGALDDMREIVNSINEGMMSPKLRKKYKTRWRKGGKLYVSLKPGLDEESLTRKMKQIELLPGDDYEVEIAHGDEDVGVVILKSDNAKKKASSYLGAFEGIGYYHLEGMSDVEKKEAIHDFPYLR